MNRHMNMKNYTVTKKNLLITFGYVLKAPRLTFPADIVLVGSIWEGWKITRTVISKTVQSKITN